ncbi:MAG: hypothetical protein WBR26_19900 [Candidatus Acidiferrum sp.]
MQSFQGFFHSIASFVFQLGGIGLLIVGIFDSSILMAPLANDLLVVALTADHPDRMAYYAVMAALGSTIGCAITDVLSRKAEEGVREKVGGRRFKFVESQLRKHAGWALALSAVIPPPFPFTPFVVAAAGTGYPRKKLLAIVAGARLVRFSAEGGLAIVYGKGILNLAKSPVVEYVIIGLIVIAVAGSGLSVFRWIQQSRSGRHAHRRTQTAY